VLVLPCDLPQLTAGSLQALSDDAAGADLVIAPDKSGSGTNALVVRSDLRFEFHFGERSYASHLAQAAAIGARAVVHRSAALGFDVDTPDDFARWCAAFRGGDCDFPDGIVRTRSVLHE
jgi:2-phospho-L-lactate guanylyltransferase